MEKNETFVNIVIPNLNGQALLETCLASIKSQSFTSYVITIVDNGSDDDSVDWINSNHPDVCVISFKENTGFSAAVNAGILSSDHPYIFLLNNDTELAPDCLEQLFLVARKSEEFHFFAPKMLSFSNRNVLDGAGDGFLRGGAGYRLGTMESDSDCYSKPGPVFGACAGAVLYKRSFFEIVSCFDEDFFAYLEDVDLNLRANRAGLCCYYVPDAKVYHIGCATTGSKFNKITIRLSTRNSFFVILKNYSIPVFIRFLPVIVIYQFAWLLFVMKKKMLGAYFHGMLGVLKDWKKMRNKFVKNQGKLMSDKDFVSCLKQAEETVIDSIMQRRSASGKGNSLLKLYSAVFL